MMMTIAHVCVCSIVVENADERCTRPELEAAFGAFGNIATMNYNVSRHKLIKYTVPDAARLAIQRMNLVLLCGCCISVNIYVQ